MYRKMLLKAGLLSVDDFYTTSCESGLGVGGSGPVFVGGGGACALIEIIVNLHIFLSVKQH